MRILALLCGILLIGSLPVRADEDADNGVMAKLVAGKLFRMEKGVQHTVHGADMEPVKYFAIYYSAQWCPPCHRFTPDLVKFYNDFKPSHPEFELIFVSEDQDVLAMHSYMKEMAMPWPAVRFDALKHDGVRTFKGSGIEKFANHGIPDLVLVDAGGNVLSDSYQGNDYVGPQKVIDDIQKLVP